MKKKILAITLMVALTLSLVMACGKNDEKDTSTKATTKTANQEKESLVIPVSTSITSLNRLLESMKEGYLMLAGFNDELFYKAKEETRFYLAESCEVSEDNLTYTVKLKDNLKWHDGETITADDVIFTLDCIKNTNNGTDFTNVAFINDKEVQVAKKDELTVTFTLPEVSASYETLLGSLILLPEHAYKGNTDIKSSEVNLTDIGSGPYKLKEFKDGESLVLEAFDGYYGGNPEIKTLVYKVIPDASAQEIALQNGEINLMELSTEKSVEKYEGEENLTVHSFAEGRTNYLACNKFSSTWSDKKAVQAIFAALDQEKIIEGAYGETMAEPANTIFSTQTYYHDESIEGYKQNIDTAKKLAKETGLTEKTLKLYYNADRAYMKDTALIVQQQLKDVGVQLEVEGVESNGFFDIVFGDAADYDLYLNGYVCAGDPDETVVGMYDGTWGINVNTSQEILDLFTQGRETLDVVQREEIYKELQKKAADEYLVYPIAYPNYKFVSSASLQGADELQTTPIFEDFLKLSQK